MSDFHNCKRHLSRLTFTVSRSLTASIATPNMSPEVCVPLGSVEDKVR